MDNPKFYPDQIFLCDAVQTERGLRRYLAPGKRILEA